MDQLEYLQTRLRYNFLRNRLVELEIQINKNINDPEVLPGLRKEYREAVTECNSILISNIELTQNDK